MKKIFIYCAIVVLYLSCVPRAHALEQEAGSAGTLTTFIHNADDPRVTLVKAFLHEYRSPLEDAASVFIEAADRNNLDWRLVVAIAGTESTFGKQVPVGSYNAWGWGIPTGASSGIAFSDWEHGINTVSEGLNKNYLQKGAAGLTEIGSIYAASPVWATHVQYFIDKMMSFTPTDKTALAISL